MLTVVFFQWFELGLGDRKGSWLTKTACATCLQTFSSRTSGEWKLRLNWLTLVYLENGCWNGGRCLRYFCCVMHCY